MLRTIAGVVLGVFGFLLSAEALFRVLPVGTATLTGYHVDPAILSYPPRHRWRAATGWDLRNAQTLRSNNLGFASERDFVPDADAVALIGDSYVEASMLPAQDRPGPQLERLLGHRRAVYPLGGPGSSLLDYAERIRFAYQTLAVRDFVVLMEPGDVRQALCGSGNVHSACLDPTTLAPATQRQAAPSPLKQVLRHSALAQYLVGQIRADPDRLLRAAFVRSVPEPDERRRQEAWPATPALTAREIERVDAVGKAFFERIAPYRADSRLIVVVDGRRPGAATQAPALHLERDRFMAAARAAGLTVVDAERHYDEHARQSRLSLTVGPYDGHLNARGVTIAMAAAAGALR